MFLCTMVCAVGAKEFVRYQQGALAPLTAMIVSQDSLETAGDDLLKVVGTQASFPDGDDTFYQWLEQHVVYPAECMEAGTQGRVIVSFIVERDGTLSNIKALQSPDERLSQEAVRVVQAMPKWNPGKNEIVHMPKWADSAKCADGFIRTRIDLPISFRLPADAGETIAKCDEDTFNMHRYWVDVDSDYVGHMFPDFMVYGNPKAATLQLPADQSGRIYDIVETNASFPGGDEACARWLAQNIQYPAICRNNGIQGRVILSFVVELDGSLSNAKVVRSGDENLSNEALRVITLMPKWNPATSDGKRVRSRYNLPILFRLSAGDR